MAQFMFFLAGEKMEEDSTWGMIDVPHVPHIGEIITRNDETGKGQAYEVTMVIYPLGEEGGDIFVRHIGTAMDAERSARGR